MRLPWSFRRGRIVGTRKIPGWAPNQGGGWWERKISVPVYAKGVEALALTGIRDQLRAKRSSMAAILKMSTVHYAKLESGALALPDAQWTKALHLARGAAQRLTG